MPSSVLRAQAGPRSIPCNIPEEYGAKDHPTYFMAEIYAGVTHEALESTTDHSDSVPLG